MPEDPKPLPDLVIIVPHGQTVGQFDPPLNIANGGPYDLVAEIRFAKPPPPPARCPIALEEGCFGEDCGFSCDLELGHPLPHRGSFAGQDVYWGANPHLVASG
jgi:hypothetical protein